MIKRLNIYFKEMYPIIPRLLLGFIVFGEIYFILLLNYGITDFSLGIQEIVGGITVFGFLMFLRIADDFKDYESDKRLFPDRAFPSDKVYKKDLNTVVAIDIAVLTILNFVFMNNQFFYLFLMAYGVLMSLWFFQKHKISKSLPLALVTHNPVQMVLNLYIISFCCIKYNLKPFTLTSFLVLMTLYFPALIWEVSRKIRAPKDETEYTTYSKLFGHKKATIFVLILTLVDIVTNLLLVINLNIIGFFVLIVNVVVMTAQFIMFIKNPERFKLVTRVEIYTYITEATMLLIIPIYMLVGKI